MAYLEAYEAFINKHKKSRTGEDRRRLEEGHGHAERMFLEQVWWPAIGHFEDLIPEYQVTDYKGGTRYLDFAWVRSPYRICIEIDGYGPHQRDVGRWQYADHLQRQNDLVLDGWIIIRFSYDDVKERPRLCERTLQQVQGKWFGGYDQKYHLVDMERFILHMAIVQEELIPAAVVEELGVSEKTARKWLRSLVEKGLLVPISGNLRLRKYKVNADERLSKYLK
ncbi:MAG: DNA-binding response regulator [Paenibacillaceae bacterium]|nr:DNA-binding response regulator [Paenibacillaceae bacterium]